MQKDLRVFDHDDTGQIFFDFRISLQQGKQIDAPHAFSHLLNRLQEILGRRVDLGGDGQHLFHIPVYGVKDFFPAAVFPEIFVDSACKFVQIQLIQFVI